MNSTQKQYLPGLDLLKFILAVLIISGHCQLFLEHPSLQQWWGHLTSIAVPIFFGISSFLFFRKVYSAPNASNTSPILTHSIKRLAILFVCWYVLMIPMTYFQFFSVATMKETIFAFFLSCSMRGYWFIKALIINTIILYFFRKKKALKLCTIIALIVYFYCAYNYVYHFNPLLEGIHPYYSFYYHTAYFCCGALFARYYRLLHFEEWNSNILVFAWFVSFVLSQFSFFDPIFRLVSFVLLFPVFHKQKALISTNTYKNLRNMSIILYMVHFSLIWMYNGACERWLASDSVAYNILQYSITRFIVITAVSISIAWLILTLEKRPRSSFLQYFH